MFEWTAGGYDAAVREQIRGWLAEDIGSGDITTETTIPRDSRSKAVIHVKESGIIAGLPIAKLVFEVVDPSLVFHPNVQDGEQVDKGTVLATVEGSTHSLLTGERLALNLMQRLSGIATKTRAFVDALEGLAGSAGRYAQNNARSSDAGEVCGTCRRRSQPSFWLI